MATPKKIKKKNWHEMVAPALFNKQSLGEMYVSEPQKAVGRIVTANLMSLTNDPKRQHINIKLKLSSFQDNKFFTEVSSYQMSPSSLKRFVRRGRDRVDDSVLFKTADNKIIRVKTLFLTAANTKKSVRTQLRRESRGILFDYLSKRTYDAIISDLISYKIQSQLRNQLKKIYPLKTTEVRVLEIARGKIKYEPKREPRRERKQEEAEDFEETDAGEEEKPQKAKSKKTKEEEDE